MATILSPLNKLPNRQECTVLLVGDEGTGKHDLGLTMLNQHLPFSLQVRTASTLPLPEKNESSRPRLDYLVFLLNVTQENSLKVVEESLHRIDARYFVGRSCLVATGVEFPNQRIIETETVMKLADSFDLPLVFGEVQTEAALACLSSKVIKMAEIASGFSHRITPMLIDATRKGFETDL